MADMRIGTSQPWFHALAALVAASAGIGCGPENPERIAEPPEDVALARLALAGGDLTGDTHAWETVPSVIRADGSESFVLEVDPVDGVTSVELVNLNGVIIGPSDLRLHDDGVAPDRARADGIFSAGPFRYDTAFPLPTNYEGDAQSPAGLFVFELGQLVMTTAAGEGVAFFIEPQIGALAPGVPVAQRQARSATVRTGSHLIELRQARADSQRLLRGMPNGSDAMLRDVYAVLPDFFDFAVVSATSHIESPTNPSRGNAGLHATVKIDYTGTGRAMQDDSALFGSAGRLKSINAIDVLRRGWLSNNWVHEMLHQWSAFLPFDLGMTDGAHYLPNTNAASLVGGMTWIDDGDGTFSLDCDGDGRSAARTAAPLDLYMMGLVAGPSVPTLRQHLGGLFDFCGQVIPPSALGNTLTIDEVRLHVGARTPGPDTAQRAFHVAFMVEAHARDLTDSEFTFFNTLAEHATRAVPASEPNPLLSANWVPMTRYFGSAASFRSDVPAPPSTVRLKAMYKNGDFGNIQANWVKPHVRVVSQHDANIPLEELTVRYWFTNETAPSQQVFALDIAQNERSWANIPASLVRSSFATIPRVTRADTYLEIGFRAGAGALSPGSAVKLETAFHPQDWSRNYGEGDDYSQTPVRTYIDSNRVTVYHRGSLVWGVEPR
jgi:hypothetical protein